MHDDRQARRGVRVFFFAYFLYVGVFSPFFSLYLSEVGLSITQIGIVMSLPQVVRLGAPVFWGWLADRTGERVLLLRVSAAMAMLAALGLWPAGANFYGVVLLGLALFFAASAQMPIMEAIALDASSRDAGVYSRMRVWGSYGFLVAVLAMGPVLDLVGVASVPGWLALLLAFVLASTWLQAPAAGRARERLVKPVLGRLREPRVAAVFASMFLMICAHAALYAFFSLYLHEKGYSKSTIGMIWALGVVAEIAMFYLQRPLFQRFGAMSLVGACMALGVLRFALIGISEGSLGLIVLSQLLHALTFGTHHTAIQVLLQTWFDPGQQARAQALYATIGYGFGGTAGGLAASWLWVHVSPAAAFHGAAIMTLAGWLAWWIGRRSPPVHVA